MKQNLDAKMLSKLDGLNNLKLLCWASKYLLQHYKVF